jgi:hypothetical protein
MTRRRRDDPPTSDAGTDEGGETAGAEPALRMVRLYTPEEADRLVPRLEEAFATIARHRETLRGLVGDLERLGVDLAARVPPEVLARPGVGAQVARALVEHRAIRKVIEDLEDLGVEVKSIDGLCDVRSRHDGRIVYLCWRRGEPGFLFWHELDAGFKGRQRILRTSDFEGTLLN